MIFEVDKDEVIRAFNETERKGKDKPLEYFKNVLRKKPQRESFEEKLSPSVGNSDLDDWLKE
jgi:hypothetical protein